MSLSFPATFLAIYGTQRLIFVIRMPLESLVSHLNPVRLLTFNFPFIEVHFYIIMMFGLLFSLQMTSAL